MLQLKPSPSPSPSSAPQLRITSQPIFAHLIAEGQDVEGIVEQHRCSDGEGELSSTHSRLSGHQCDHER